MNTMEQISCIKSMNIIEDTIVDYSQTDRNAEMANLTGRVTVTDLTTTDVTELGWPTWSDERPITLIPFYLYDYLEYGQELTCIDGGKTVVTPDYRNSKSNDYIDNDHRYGYIAHGFYPKED